MKFSQKLKEFRNEKGISQTVLADELGISRSHLAMIESDKRPIASHHRNKLAEYSGKDLKWWISGTEYDHDCYVEMTALSMFLDYLIDKAIIKEPNDIDNEMAHVTKVIKKELEVKFAKRNKILNGQEVK